jgi:hypothetical protein
MSVSPNPREENQPLLNGLSHEIRKTSEDILKAAVQQTEDCLCYVTWLKTSGVDAIGYPWSEEQRYAVDAKNCELISK